MLCGYMREIDSSCIIHMLQLKVAQPTTYGMGKKKNQPQNECIEIVR